MTQPDEDPRDDALWRDESTGAQPPLDEDALWREIVANYGDRPAMGEPLPEAPPEPAPSPARDVFDRGYLDSLDTARAEESRAEDHFVPPEPPPVPGTTPARLLAWVGLFGAPLLMLVAVVLGTSYPDWLSLLLVVGFVGGFVFLVATMSRRGDDHDGDDGAVV